MRTVMRLPILLTTAACAAVFLAGCGGGIGGSGGTNEVTSQSLIGSVFNVATGEPVSGATVRLASRSAATDAAGNYVFDNLATSFRGGELTVTAPGFAVETSTVSPAGSALLVSPVGLTPAGAATNVTPASGAVLSTPVAAAPNLPHASLSITPDSLPGTADVPISITAVVNAPVVPLATLQSVRGQAVNDVSDSRPEIYLDMFPYGLVLTRPVPVTLPLPFALAPGSRVPVLQQKQGAWREVGNAVVDGTGAAAVGQIAEFRPTGVAGWHALRRSTTNEPELELREVSQASISNDMNQLPDRSYVVNRTLQNGRMAQITARFRLGFESPKLPTSPVDEDALVLGRNTYRERLSNRFFRGPWNVNEGPVTFSLRENRLTILRILGGQVVSEAGSYMLVDGQPTWPRPQEHNQGGVQ